jgi:hypothetical protein
MSEGSGGEPEREQDPWSQPTESAPPGPAPAQPETSNFPSAGPDSWSTPWANPAWPAAQPEPGGYPSAGRQDPQAAGQYGYQPAPGQYGYLPTPGQYPQAGGQYGYQPTPGQYPAAAGQYGPQQWPAYPAARRNNRVAIAALVCGLAQFLLGLLIVGNIVLAIPAIICGAIGLKQTRQRGESGRGMAIAGLVLGILGVVYFVIIVVVLIILGSIHHHGST